MEAGGTAPMCGSKMFVVRVAAVARAKGNGTGSGTTGVDTGAVNNRTIGASNGAGSSTRYGGRSRGVVARRPSSTWRPAVVDDLIVSAGDGVIVGVSDGGARRGEHRLGVTPLASCHRQVADVARLGNHDGDGSRVGRSCQG